MFGNILSSIFSEMEYESNGTRPCNCGCTKCRQDEAELSFETDVAGIDAEYGIEDFTKQANPKKCSSNAGFACRRGTRPLSQVNAIVLHQTAGNLNNDPTAYFSVGAHYVVMPNGRILKLYPETDLIQHANSFNGRSVGIEFAGNFPDIERKQCWWDCAPKQNGKCVKGVSKPIYKKVGHTVKSGNVVVRGCLYPTQEQMEAGRRLVTAITEKVPSIRHILAHRQSSGLRGNDPGPEIWYNVGEWAVQQLGLGSGGATFKEEGGSPIPASWRKPRPVEAEFEFEF